VIAGILVGVILDRELAVRAFDLFARGGLLDLQDFVIVAFGRL
jgi:hypothetical protein